MNIDAILPLVHDHASSDVSDDEDMVVVVNEPEAGKECVVHRQLFSFFYSKYQIFIILALYAEAFSTSGGAHLRGLTPGQHSLKKKTSQRYLAVDDTVSYLTGPGVETQTSRTDSDVLNNKANRPISN